MTQRHWKIMLVLNLLWTVLVTIVTFSQAQSTDSGWPSNKNSSSQDSTQVSSNELTLTRRHFHRNSSLINVNRKAKTSQQLNFLKLWDSMRGKEEDEINHPEFPESPVEEVQSLMIKWAALRFRPKFHLQHPSMLPRNEDDIGNNNSSNGLVLKLIGPNLVYVHENENMISGVLYKAVIQSKDRAGNGSIALKTSKLKYSWFLHKLDSHFPNETNANETFTLKEESTSELESSIEIQFTSVNSKKEANVQYIINSIVEIDGQDNNNDNDHRHVTSHTNSKKNVTSIVLMASKLVYVNYNTTNVNVEPLRGKRDKRQAGKASASSDNVQDRDGDKSATGGAKLTLRVGGNRNGIGTTAQELQASFTSAHTDTPEFATSPASNDYDNDEEYVEYPESEPTSTTVDRGISATTPTPSKSNLTKDEIIQSLREGEQRLISVSVRPGKTQVTEFLSNLHKYGENLCRLQHEGSKHHFMTQGVDDSALIISGKLITIQVEHITSKLEKYLMKKEEFKAHFYNNKTSNNSDNHFEAEFGQSLLQYCSEVDEGMKYVCQPLCFVTMNLQGQASNMLFSSVQPAQTPNVWNTFLVNSDSYYFIDPDHDFQLYERPVIFRISIPHLSPNETVGCSRWNQTHGFWDNTTCTKSKLITTDLVECHCQRFGYFKVQYERQTSPTKTTVSKTLSLLINGSFDEIVGNRKDEFMDSIQSQLVSELKLSSKRNIENIDVWNKNNETILVRFRLNIGNNSSEKQTVDLFKQLISNNSLSLTDLQGKALSIPIHYLELGSDEELFEISDPETQITIASGLVIGILLAGAAVFIGVAAIRKYKRERENSVRKVKKPANTLQLQFPTFNSSLTHPNIETRVDLVSNSITRRASFSSTKETFSTESNFNIINQNKTRDKLSIPRDTTEISIVDVNPNAVPAFSLNSFPNSTIH